MITLNYRYEYVQENEVPNAVEKSKSTIEDFMNSNPKGNEFSTNGHLVHQ